MQPMHWKMQLLLRLNPTSLLHEHVDLRHCGGGFGIRRLRAGTRPEAGTRTAGRFVAPARAPRRGGENAGAIDREYP